MFDIPTFFFEGDRICGRCSPDLFLFCVRAAVGVLISAFR